VGDSLRLRQIVTNLVGNAIKFTPRGHVLCQVACDAMEGGKARIHIQVQDTGIGIPPDKLTNIFEKFTQADSSTTRRYGGTGLGLAICRMLAGMMDGRIWAESRVGEGSTFHVVVPLPLSSDPAPATQALGTAERGEAGAAGEESLRGLRILASALPRRKAAKPGAKPAPPARRASAACESSPPTTTR
jgi:hypothetical protein